MKNIFLQIICGFLAGVALAQSNPVIPIENFGAEIYNLNRDIMIDSFHAWYNRSEYNSQNRSFPEIVGISEQEMKKITSPTYSFDIKAYFRFQSEDKNSGRSSYHQMLKISGDKVLDCYPQKKRIFEDQKYNCNFNYANKIQPEVARISYGMNIARAEFLGLSDDGKGLKLRQVHSHPIFSQFLPSGADSFKVVYDYKFKDCTDEFGRTLNAQPEPKNLSIEDMVRALKGSNFDSITVCNLVSGRPVFTTETFSNQELWELTMGGTTPGSARLTINSENSFYAVILDTNDGIYNKILYTRFERDRDQTKQKVAVEGLKNFINWVKNDYAEHLLKIYYNKLDSAAIELASQAFFRNNQAQLQLILTQIRSNFSELPLMEKISWLRNITIALNTVAELETQLKTPMTVNLDKMIRTRVN